MTDLRDTRSFKIKKWLLFAVCLINIIFLIIIMLIPAYFLDYYYYGSVGTYVEPEDDVYSRRLRGVAFFVIIVESFGLIGAYKENCCLTLCFAIIMAICTLINVLSSLITTKNIGSAMVNIAITILAFAFTRDLKRVGVQTRYPMVVIQTAHTMPQNVIPMYPSVIIGYQYPQQYNNGMSLCSAPPLQQQPPNYDSMGVYSGLSLPQQPPNYLNIAPYMPSGLRNDYQNK